MFARIIFYQLEQLQHFNAKQSTLKHLVNHRLEIVRIKPSLNKVTEAC